MELSMRDLFPVCADVLADVLVPLHYTELTKRALRRMSVPLSAVNLAKEAENVREKLLQYGQRGTFYTGPPAYAGALRSWFVSDAQLQLVVDHIAVPGSAKAGVDGALEALMRSPYMEIRNPNLVHTERINRVRASGLVLERHIAQWFASRYPMLYRDPPNAGNWRQGCAWDFSLAVNGRTFKIDVAGPDEQGAYGSRGRKQHTDLHLICRVSGDECLIEGVVRGAGFQEKIDPGSIFSPTAFVVWLNCARDGIDYWQVARTMYSDANDQRVAADR
jgi:hypothetical protein